MAPFCFFVLLCGFLDITLGALTCEDCPNCAGTCRKTPNNFECECASDKTGDNCDICLVRTGWVDGGNGYQYFKTSTKSNYNDAMKECEKFGGHLAIYGIRDPAVFSTVAEADVYVGLTDRSEEATFMWNDVVNADYTITPWGTGQPSGAEDHDCGFLKDFSGNILLSDHLCSASEFGLCEKPIGCPAAIPKFDPKNGCKYFLLPPAARHVSDRICKEQGGTLAVQAVNTGNVLKKILYHYVVKGVVQDGSGIYVGFVKSGDTFLADDGTTFDVNSNAAKWQPGSPGDVINDCLYTFMTPDWFDYTWLDDSDCSDYYFGLCEVCSADSPLDLKTCKSGKVCNDNQICVIHEGSCFEECYCSPGNIATGPCAEVTCSGYSCGDNAACVFDDATQTPSCKCDKGYVPVGVDGEGCYAAECDPACINAVCVINPVGDVLSTAKCECDDNFMPHPTNAHECIADECADGSITCTGGRCCIIDDGTKDQECICNLGFYKSTGDPNTCVDPTAGVTACGANSKLYLNIASAPPIAECYCDDHHLEDPNNANACFQDGCSSVGSISCKDNAVCCLTDSATNTQGCVCLTGYYKDPDDNTRCIDLCTEKSCPTNTYCVISSESGTPEARCICDTNFVPPNTPGDACVEDQCASGAIDCSTSTTNAVCVTTNALTQVQGCVCQAGYHQILNNPALTQVTCSQCPDITYTFPSTRSVENYILVDVDMPELTEFTICTQYTPISGDGSGTLLSYNTLNQDDAILILFHESDKHIFDFKQITPVGEKIIDFTPVVGTTYHMCWVLSVDATEVRFYLDGTDYADTQYTTPITALPAGFGTIVIGQEQDKMGSGFEASKAFAGTIKNLIMWTRALSATEISNYRGDACACPSGALFQLTSDVVTLKGAVTQSYANECVV